MSSIDATSAGVRPSRSQSTNTSRWRSGEQGGELADPRDRALPIDARARDR